MSRQLDDSALPAALAEINLEKSEKLSIQHEKHGLYEQEDVLTGDQELIPTHDELHGPHKLRRVSDNMCV